MLNRRAGIFAVAELGLSQASSFVVGILLARAVVPSEYGVYALLMTGMATLGGIINALVTEPYTVFGSGRYRDRIDYYSAAVFQFAVMANGLMFFCGAIFLVGAVVFQGSVNNFGMYALMVFALPLVALVSLVKRIYYVEEQYLAVFLSSLCTSGFTIVATIVVFGHGVLNGGVAFAIIGSSSIPPIVAFYLRIRETYPTWRQALNTTILDVRYADYIRWALATTLVSQSFTHLPMWIGASLLGTSDIGHIRAIQNIIFPVNILVSASAYIYLPILSRIRASGCSSEFRDVQIAWYGILLVCFGAYGGGVVIFHDALLAFLYGGQYSVDWSVVALLVLANGLAGIGVVSNAALKATESSKQTFLSYLSSLALVLSLIVPLVNWFGLVGLCAVMALGAASYSTLGAVLAYERTAREKVMNPHG